MRSWKAVLTLAAKFNWAHKPKFALLSLLVAVGMTVFLIVTELSRVSSAGLDEAIAQDVGETGTYVVEVRGGLGLSAKQLAGHVNAAVLPFTSRTPMMVEVLPRVQPECPPYRELGPQQILVLRDGSGEPVALPFGQNLPSESEFCLEGQQIPASALYLPTAGEQRTMGIGLFIDSSYREVVTSATTDPVSFRFVVVTGTTVDDRSSLTTAVSDRLRDIISRQGLETGLVSVTRVDSAGGIRDASEGIKLVYLIIAWGVLILGGLGLLVAELIIVRDRTWFFGLARALGATSKHLATLIFADISLVLIAGTALAMLLATALQPAAGSFAKNAFALDVQLVQASTIPRLLAGGLLVLLIAGVFPAIKATRQDPIDVLEPRRSEHIVDRCRLSRLGCSPSRSKDSSVKIRMPIG